MTISNQRRHESGRLEGEKQRAPQEGGAQQPPTPPANQIYAVPAKAQYEINFPVVEGYTDPGITRLAVDWAKVPTLVLDPMEVPDTVLMKGLTTQDGALAAYGPGAAAVVTLDAWRKRVRVQQVAFTLAKVVAQHWQQEQGDTIPMHRLFPQLLAYAQRFLSSKLDPRGNRAAQDVALNPYFQRAVGILFDALQAVDETGRNQERPVITPGPAGERSTRHVEFFTGRQPWPVQKCHLNAMVADTRTWEQSAATALDAHDAVLRWVKNDHLGFVVPYRKDGVRRRYLPDFIVELTDGQHLILEIKGDLGDAEIKAAAAYRWCNAVNNDGRFGRWAYHMVRQPPNLLKLLDGSGRASKSGGESLAASESRLETLEREVFRVFGREEDEGRVCSLVFGKLREPARASESFDLRAVVSALEWSQLADRKKAAVRALDFLAFGPVQVLERQFKLMPAIGRYADSTDAVDLSEEEVRRAVEANVLVLGATGQEVPDFLDRILVSYAVRPPVRDALPRAERQ